MRRLTIFGALVNDGPVAERDWSTLEGARELAARIEAYWASQGFMVSCRLEPRGFHPVLRATRYDILSDLENGLPKYRALPSRKEAA